MPRIHGLTLIREEWPLGLLAINHALLHHVDRLHCAVQVSSDATLEGVQRLRGYWGDRLTVVAIETPAYLQEAIVSTLARQVAATAAPHDWLYVFDADEFAVSPAALPLREQLAALPPGVMDLRYRIWNWIAPHDFDDLDLASYGRLRHRAFPCVFLDLPPLYLAQEIGRGFVNWFDLPFHDKSLFRLDSLAGRWIGPGAHRLKPPASSPQPATVLAPSHFHTIHLPLLSRRRLAARLAQARNLQAQGFPFHHGWQSQMLLELDDRQELEAFWQRHSIGALPASAPGLAPSEESDLFATAVEQALALTRSLLDAPPCPEAPQGLSDELCLRTIHQLQEQLKTLHRELMRNGVNQLAAAYVRPGPAPDPA